MKQKFCARTPANSKLSDKVVDNMIRELGSIQG